MPQITQIKSNQAKEKRSDFPKTFPGQGRGTRKKKDSPSQQPLRAHPSSQDLGLVFLIFFFFFAPFNFFRWLLLLLSLQLRVNFAWIPFWIPIQFPNFDLDLRFSFRFQFPLGVRVVVSFCPSRHQRRVVAFVVVAVVLWLVPSFFFWVSHFLLLLFCALFFAVVVHPARRARCNYLVYALSFSFFRFSVSDALPTLPPPFPTLLLFCFFFYPQLSGLEKLRISCLLTYCIWRSQMKSSPLRSLGFLSAFT